MFRLKGKGMPNVAGRGHGDLFVSVKVQVPKKLSKEQRKLVEELRRTMDDTRDHRRARRTKTAPSSSA